MVNWIAAARERGEMPTSLYDISVATYLQTLAAVTGLLDKGLAFCTRNQADPSQIVETRLFEDMLPLRFQVVAVAHHSLGAIQGAKAGVFAPPGRTELLDYPALQKLVLDATESLKRLTPAEVNALEGRDMIFQLGERKIPFTVENFILSFSLPNFFFHATTTYDILRMKGVPLGKRDYLGYLRIKR
jgi:uncharacterized protein